jgi:hypothetical protein
MQTNTDPEFTALKLVVRVLQDIVRQETFDTYADLAEALKVRCARLKIRCDSATVSNAIDRLELGGKRPLVATYRGTIEQADTDYRGESVGVSQRQAVNILTELQRRTGITPGHPMPKAPQPVTEHAVTRRKAAAIVAQAIIDTVATVDALEEHVRREEKSR